MGYSANFTVGQNGTGKVKFFSAKQEVYHACRDLQKNGKKVRLKSESIRPDLTCFNQTFLKTKTGWKKPKNMQEVFNEMDDRFSAVVGARRKDGTFSSIRKDAIAMREVILSLGNSEADYYAKYGDDVEAMAKDPSFKVMREWADKTFGDHVLYFSIHVDEGHDHSHHAHVHMGLDTIKEVDGVKHFNQKILKPISSPKALKMAHKSFYKYLRDRGLDVALDPEKTAKTRQRLSQSEYNAIKTAKKKVAEQDKREQELDQREQDLSEWQDDLEDAEQSFRTRSKKDAKALADRKARVAQQEKEAQAKQDELDKRESDLADREQAFKQLYQKVKEMQEALQKVKDNLIAEANTALKRFKRKADQYKLYDTPEGQDLQKASHKLDPWLKPIDAPKTPDDKGDDYHL